MFLIALILQQEAFGEMRACFSVGCCLLVGLRPPPDSRLPCCGSGHQVLSQQPFARSGEFASLAGRIGRRAAPP